MSDKTYKVVLFGKIADGFDPAEAKEKLALVFDKSEKKIEKLFKKPRPVVVRKHLTQEMAQRYQMGLDKIGVLCEIQSGKGAARATPAAADSSSPPPIEPFAFEVGRGITLDNVRVVHVQMSVGAMMAFLIKWLLASIPAFLILGVLGTIFVKVLGMLGYPII
jgi:hypothetical protein